MLCRQRGPTSRRGVVDEIASILQWLDCETEGAIREFGRLAVAVSLVPSSNMIRRTDLRRRTPRDPQPQQLLSRLSIVLGQILDDLLDTTIAGAGRATHVANDVRQLRVEKDNRYSLIVTSPPYLNGTNYFRNTKLELIALGFIEDERQLSDLRTMSITAGINNVTKRRSAPREIPEVERVATILDRVAYDQRIPMLVRLYFSDMLDALAAIRASATDCAELLLDIGDSRFAGTEVPTHELLTVIAGYTGWSHVETLPLRDRRSYDGAKLVQVVQRFIAQ